ncbi:MAG: N-methyl-D-aspartate receptor NMDAR2C subunit [Betaproteobacteria bacterium]|nr:N-methyl-D-aspartate receptor NMDAR2C subunit [Betaproteobacteria bacterium]
MLSARRWLQLWQRCGVARQADGALADTYAALVKRYAEAQRHYHTAQHIAECLAHFEAANALCEHETQVEIALWFHDSIYEPRAKDNEAQSAAWAAAVMRNAGLSDVAQTRVHELIMATRHDALPLKHDEQVLVDIDLSILGADVARFDEYERQVRAEYAWVPGFVFKQKRREVLQGFLEQPSIYSTAHFKDKLEKKARENLARSILANR